MFQTHDQSNCLPKSLHGGQSSTAHVSDEPTTFREAQLQENNKKVWRPWWTAYLVKCEGFIAAAKRQDYDTVARLIN